MENLEIISVHYKTPNFIYDQHKSIRNLYPNLKYRIIDGSDDGNKYFIDIENQDLNFKVDRFGHNIHHGPGMDYGIKTSKQEFLLILDSDVSIKKDLIKQMFNLFSGYSVGKKITVNSDGLSSWQKSNNKNFIYDYIHPYCMLIKKDEYLKHKPFIKHGAPCIESMIDLYDKKLTNMLSHFEIEEYINLTIRGTRSKWGINL